ncbi:sulfotransferase 6B1-like [Discoglossus pictus]
MAWWSYDEQFKQRMAIREDMRKLRGNGSQPKAASKGNDPSSARKDVAVARAKLKQAPSPRVLATHFNYDYIPKSIFDKKSKILVVLRNPKDAAVSFFHFYNNDPLLPNYSSWDTFFQDFISGNVVWGSYFDHAVAWNKHIDDEGVFIITFEQMKKDLEGAVKRIADFFGLPLNQEQIHQIADKGTFKSMKKKSKETHGQFGEFLFRKGEVGDWKNYFTKAQSEEVDAKFEEYLAGTKAGELMNYNVYCKF